jgi:Dolichyl-phosphate-mannose-protein mannosyltransferase
MKKRRKVAPPFQASIRKAEWFIAFALTGLAVTVHVVNLTHAGGLWRDEAAAVNLALFPSFGEIWTHLEHESFPLLLTVLLRSWNAVGLGETDLGWRFFGFLIGLCVLAALWWNARQFSKSPPLFSLLLFGLSPTLIRWGDSLRAYGLGVFFLLLALGFIWKVARAPSRRAVILATAASVLAVQALYQSMFMLVAFCLAGALLAERRRDFKCALLVLALIVPPALSLLPYLGVIGRANQWNVVTEVPLGLSRIWLVFQRALGAPGPLMFWLWAVLLLAAIVTAFVLARAEKKTAHGNDDRDAAFFLAAVIVAVTGAYYLFLTVLKFPTEVWYYLAWMGVAAVAIDALLGRIIREDRVRGLRLPGVVLLAAIMSPGIWQQAQVRMTNLDLVATRLNREAGNDDLILMHPWFCGPSFGRYYKSSAPWLTLPPLADHQLQRLDLFKEQMQQDAPIQPVLEKMEATLRAGHTVWLVGYYPFSNPPRPPPPLPRAGEGPGGWNEAPYMTVYGMQVAYFLQAHAGESKPLELEITQTVNPFENFPVRAVVGWRPSRF